MDHVNADISTIEETSDLLKLPHSFIIEPGSGGQIPCQESWPSLALSTEIH